MTQLPSVGTTTTTQQAFGNSNALNELQIDDFLDLMIAELQNQDPLNPLDNADLIAQISQIREVGATDQLTETLEAVLLGQNISSATSLIGQQVTALDVNGDRVVGTVDRIIVNEGQPELQINASSQATPSDADGRVEEGTYRYKLVFERSDGQLGAIDVGPITTTGKNGLDTSIQITNIPSTTGQKTLYRTDGTGTGDYHIVNNISGATQQYVDSVSTGELSNAILNQATVPEFGGSRTTASLNNVLEVRTQGN